jgi:hypothetical protein
MANVWEARRAVHKGLQALDWYRYLRAMWIICGELQDLYSTRLSVYDRSLEGETLDLVRQIAIAQDVTPEVNSIAGAAYGRWQELFSAQKELMKIGERHAWLVFVDLTGEIVNPRLRYHAAEWVNTAATRIWMSRSVPPRQPVWINNPHEEASEEDPVMLTLSRLKHIVDEAGVADELDPAELKSRIL